MILRYSEFIEVFNKKLFEDSYSSLLEKIAKNPERYIGLFRPTKPKTKLIQNITQSHEIRFGDALESIFEIYFSKVGFNILEKRFYNNDKELSIDQLVRKDNIIYLIEQKVRDDHDSTKKVGQFENFELKYNAIVKRYPTCEVVPIMWFIDDSLNKNKNYYLLQMEEMSHDYSCRPHLFYGESLFENLDDFPSEIWLEVLKYLECWKDTLPDMPEINFDLDANSVFNEIKNLDVSIFRKLFNNQDIIEQIFPIIFPEGTVLKLLQSYFYPLKQPIYHTLYNNIAKIISECYSSDYTHKNKGQIKSHILVTNDIIVGNFHKLT